MLQWHPTPNVVTSMYADGTELSISMGGRDVLESDHFRSAGVQDMAWLDVVAELLRELSGESRVTMLLCVCTHGRLSTG